MDISFSKGGAAP